MTAWVIRAGSYGEREQWALDNGVSGGGWREIDHEIACATRADLDALMRAVYGDLSARAIANYSGQVWRLTHEMKPGDILVMPLKHERRIALGRVTEPYHYLADEPDADRRHVVGVDWQLPDLPRDSVKQDLLYTLGAFLSIFKPTRNNAQARLESLLDGGTDPGASPTSLTASASTSAPPSSEALEEAVEAESEIPDLAEFAADQIAARIGEDFTGHAFTHLIAAVLAVEGFHVEEAPPGRDGGIDILAGRGPLGLESPRLLVQVKSGQIGSEVVAQLNGLVSTHNADHGLLVTWTGLSSAAKESVRHQRFSVKVWEKQDVIDAVLRHYALLPADVRAKLPLKQVWVLDEE